MGVALSGLMFVNWHEPPTRLAQHGRQLFFPAISGDLLRVTEVVCPRQELRPAIRPDLVGLLPEAAVDQLAWCVLVHTGVGGERVVLHVRFGDEPRALPHRQVPRVRDGLKRHESGGAVAVLHEQSEELLRFGHVEIDMFAVGAQQAHGLGVAAEEHIHVSELVSVEKEVEVEEDFLRDGAFRHFVDNEINVAVFL